MKILVTLIRHVHYFIGISMPRPEQERLLVLVWVGVVSMLVGGFLFLLYLPTLLRG